MKNHTPTPNAALETFVARKAEFDTMLMRLQTLSADHFNLSPEKIHWGHVGDITRYVELLRQITDAAFQEGEHTR